MSILKWFTTIEYGKNRNSLKFKKNLRVLSYIMEIVVAIMTRVQAMRKKIKTVLCFFGLRFRFSDVNNTLLPSFNVIDLFKASSF